MVERTITPRVMSSIFELFRIGIGPSSSHTVGPMRAARRFGRALDEAGRLAAVDTISVELFGSLGATGRGHGTDRAVVMGLEGHAPESVDPDTVGPRYTRLERDRELSVLGQKDIPFDPAKHLVFHRRKILPGHPNGMRCTARTGEATFERTYYSVGGGSVVDGDDDARVCPPEPDESPYPFSSGDALLAQCDAHALSVSTLMLENEKVGRSEPEIRAGLLERWNIMRASIERGCEKEGVLPGGLGVRRRAAGLYRRLRGRSREDPLAVVDWVNLYALAVNEENASGGRVVTAPTNGAAGIIPAVLRYYVDFGARPDDDGVVRFLLAAGAVGLLYKANASISGAEVGCQGEVGVACSMAAAGLTEALGGTPTQVENAAEIGMEHNLGLTCDPVGGLVQVPCIERNAMGAVKAINASRLAFHGDGKHRVSLDQVIRTMRQTGYDMRTKYKETARGGLAVNIVEC